MNILPAVAIKAVKHVQHLVREIAFNDMAKQASGWIPDDARIERTPRRRQPIRLAFDIPRKRRLNWIRRTLDHLPH